MNQNTKKGRCLILLKTYCCFCCTTEFCAFLILLIMISSFCAGILCSKLLYDYYLYDKGDYTEAELIAMAIFALFFQIIMLVGIIIGIFSFICCMCQCCIIPHVEYVLYGNNQEQNQNENQIKNYRQGEGEYKEGIAGHPVKVLVQNERGEIESV